MDRILRAWKQCVILLAVVFLATGCKGFIPSVVNNPWQVVPLPIEESMLDISFTGDKQHGWMVGTNSSLLETKNGGKSWKQQVLGLGEQNYRLTSVNFSGDDGWIAGQPSILLHTTDAGKSWERLPLSSKLPGSPEKIVALGTDKAEMTTDVGAIYRTADGGKTWKAIVKEAFGVMRSIDRTPDGKYLAVSSTGNFFSTWEPGQDVWQPFNRNSSRKLQNMGFAPDGHMWMLARGGQIQFSNSTSPEDWAEPQNPEFSTSWGLLDLAYRTPQELWVVGGSGNLLASFDGGQSWQKDRDVEDIPANLYRIMFFDAKTGFIMGQRGTLLKYEPTV